MIAAFAVAQVDQLCRDLGVGLGGECVAFFQQQLAQGRIVFNDAVVHKLYPLVAVRVRVDVRGNTVRCPAGVTDADVRARKEVLRGKPLFQHSHSARCFGDGKAAVLENSDARGVVTAVFERVQPLQDDLCCFLLTDVTGDSAHDINTIRHAGAHPPLPSQFLSILRIFRVVGRLPVGFAGRRGGSPPSEHPPNGQRNLPLSITPNPR